MDVISLACQKQKTVVGSDTNYYLILLANGVGVEVDDINEVLNLTFAQGCVFKAVVRICKLRMDLGKPGSTMIYEAEKAVYYSKRNLVVTNRRLANVGPLGSAFRFFRDVLMRGYFSDPDSLVVDVPDPKRLDPYSFILGDMIDALEPTPTEANIIRGILVTAMMRQIVGPPRKDEIFWATQAQEYSLEIEKRERVKIGELQLGNGKNA